MPKSQQKNKSANFYTHSLRKKERYIRMYNRQLVSPYDELINPICENDSHSFVLIVFFDAIRNSSSNFFGIPNA